MAGLVLDASVTLAWLLNEQTPAAELCERVLTERANAPAMWRWEVANGLLVAERRGRISAAQRNLQLDDAASLEIEIDTECFERAWDATYALAIAHRLTIYDAAYLELAIRRALPLASFDRDLRAGATAIGVPLLG